MDDRIEKQKQEAKNYCEERMDSILETLIPQMPNAEIREWFEERLRHMNDLYQDYLSMPHD